MAGEAIHEAATSAERAGQGSPWIGLPGFRILRALRTRAGLPRAALAVREAPGGFSRVCTLEAAPDDPGDPAQHHALLHEAAVTARLRHPAVATVFDILRPDGWVVVVRPVDGNLTLAHLASALARNTNRLDERIVWHIAYTLFDCLDDVHHARTGEGGATLHGDLRPGHVLVRSDGSVVIRGFGGSRIEWAPAGEGARRAMYVAPECLAGEPSSPAADVYSAAMIAWELLVEPATCREVQEAFEQSRAGVAVPPLAALRPDLPPAIAAALDLCLSPDPDARSLSAGAVATALHRSADVLSGRELLARLHANVLSRLQGKPNPRWSTEPSRPGGVDCSAPTLRLNRSPAAGLRSDPPAAVLHPEHPLYANPANPRPAAIEPGAAFAEDEPDTMRMERSDRPPPFDDEDDDADEEVTLRQPSDESVVVRLQPPAPHVPVSSFPPVTGPNVAPSIPPLGTVERRRSRPARLAGFAIACALCAAMVGFTLAESARDTSVGSALHGQAATAAATRAQPRPAGIEAPSQPAPADTRPILVWRTHLTVNGPPEGMVFVQGVPAGMTGEVLDVPCGMRYVRIGTPPVHGAMGTVRWLAKGRTMKLPCGEATVR